MDGVTVLNTYEEVIDYSWGWHPLGIILGVLGVVIIIFVIYEAIAGSDISALIIGLPGALLILFSILISSSTIPIYQTRSQVIIDETCNMSEFFEKYEFIEQQGEIYVVAAKE